MQRLPVVLAALVVLAQIAYPLTPVGRPRDVLTVATVVLFFGASVSAAVVSRGVRFAAALVAVTAGGGLLVEAVGVATGIPFGAYRYTETLGARLLGVPVVIPMAWTMMGYPALIVGRRVSAHRIAGPLVAGAALASWDLFLDPQMVDAGHWVWAGTNGPELMGIPVVNFIGWFVVATVMMASLWRVMPDAEGVRGSAPAADDRVPIALYLWTYASSVLAHAVFFDLPESAVVGGLVMGVVVALLGLRLRHAA